MQRKHKIWLTAAAVFLGLAALGNLTQAPPEDAPPEDAAPKSGWKVEEGAGEVANPESGMDAVEPRYRVIDSYVDKGGGPGSGVTLTVIAPDKSRKDEVARKLIADYMQHDTIMVAFQTNKDPDSDYATAIITVTEQGSEWTGAEPGAVQWL